MTDRKKYLSDWHQRHKTEQLQSFKERYVERRAEILEQKKIYNKTLKSRYLRLRTGAKRRGIDVSLSFEEYATLTSLLCYYCDGELPKVGHGLDRVNSDLGYTLDNVRPCCSVCNTAKSSLTEAEFFGWVVRVYHKSVVKRG